MSLATPAKLRTLQRALYVTAKQEPARRFHALYDKVWREDILAHAFALRGSLVLGDRLYATAAFFDLLHAHHGWGVVRRQRSLGLHKLERLRKRRFLGGDLEDWRVRAGSGATAPPQTLRYIRWRHGAKRYEVLTNAS